MANLGCFGTQFSDGHLGITFSYGNIFPEKQMLPWCLRVYIDHYIKILAKTTILDKFSLKMYAYLFMNSQYYILYRTSLNRLPFDCISRTNTIHDIIQQTYNLGGGGGICIRFP